MATDTITLHNDAEALRLGYRQIDTAAAYLNEREVGEGIRASGLSSTSSSTLTTLSWSRWSA